MHYVRFHIPMTIFRRNLARWVLLAVALPGWNTGAENMPDYFAYVGTYTTGESRGIYCYRFDARTGKLAALGLAAETPNPTFIAVHPSQRFLYAVNRGAEIGEVVAFSIDRTTGKLARLNAASSHGDGPTYVTVDKTGKFLLVANYDSGSIAVLPIGADGRLGEAVSVIQHKGSSVNQERQHGPHAHYIHLSPDNRFAIVADLGLDQLLVYRFDASGGMLTPNDPPYVAVDPGAGPRHFAFDPSGRFGYVVTEMGSGVTAFTWNGTRGALTKIAAVSTLPKSFSGDNTGAEIEAHPNGKALYASNRGHDSIAVFDIDPHTGALTPVQHMSTGGKTPRFFSLDPTGGYLLAANQNGNNIVLFKIDTQTGRLAPAGVQVSLAAPVCVAFVPTI